jgi:hypothetical protein
MKPEAPVWRKEARRDRRGRRRQPATSVDSAKLIRRIFKFHEARLHGLTVEGAAEQLGISWIEAWRFEDLINALVDDRTGWTR